ncbi:MAG: HAD-IA family hydrolase [Mariprofundaceae bacterium]|nr:HAD-IA family hydrolase [Mariprofundaceae bacterium]
MLSPPLAPTPATCLTVLKEKGIPMCCVTAKPAKARIKVLDALGLTSYLSLALSPEDGFAKKPAPDMLDECCRVMGVSPADTVMVGDTRFDIEAGFNAQCMKVCYCEHGYQPLADEFEGKVMRLKDFTDLLNLLDD